MYTCPFPFSVPPCIPSRVPVLGVRRGRLRSPRVMLWGWWMRGTAQNGSQQLLTRQGGHVTSPGESNKMQNTTGDPSSCTYLIKYVCAVDL